MMKNAAYNQIKTKIITKNDITKAEENQYPTKEREEQCWVREEPISTWNDWMVDFDKRENTYSIFI